MLFQNYPGAISQPLSLFLMSSCWLCGFWSQLRYMHDALYCAHVFDNVHCLTVLLKVKSQPTQTNVLCCCKLYLHVLAASMCAECDKRSPAWKPKTKNKKHVDCDRKSRVCWHRPKTKHRWKPRRTFSAIENPRPGSQRRKNNINNAHWMR